MAAVEKPRKCPNCGTQVAPVDSICWRCYRRLPPSARPPVVRRRRGTPVPASTLIVVVLVAGLGAYFWHVRTSPTAALTAYLRAEASGDVKAMYELLSVRSRDMLGTSALAERASNPGPPRAFVVRSVKRENGAALVDLEVIPVDASPGTPGSEWHVYMVREDGRWRVDMVSTGQEQVGDETLLSARDLRRLWKTGMGRR